VADYDVIVAGLGAMGSATAYHLTKRGQRVLGLDAFPAGHTMGSSHGETRIIRMAYFEHPNYVPLLRRAYQLWEELERESAEKLMHLTGGLFIGRPEGRLVTGSLKSAQTHGLQHEMLDAGAIHRRYPYLRPRPDEVALYEEPAGVLLPERCIRACLDLAAAAGAQFRHAEPVTRWSAEAHGVTVETDSGRYTSEKLVVTAGAWAGKLLGDLGLPLKPERIPIFWFEGSRDPHQFDLGRMPIWIWQSPEYGDFFTTPHVEWPGVKIGKHHSRHYVDPDDMDRTTTPDDERVIRGFLEDRVPDLAGRVASSKVCLYTNTPDEDFVIDIHPAFHNVSYAAGFSGHGFKFACVIGEILADLTMTGQATPNADFLKAARLSDPKTEAGAAR
jgi:sarcosine oxidase